MISKLLNRCLERRAKNKVSRIFPVGVALETIPEESENEEDSKFRSDVVESSSRLSTFA